MVTLYYDKPGPSSLYNIINYVIIHMGINCRISVRGNAPSCPIDDLHRRLEVNNGRKLHKTG